MQQERVRYMAEPVRPMRGHASAGGLRHQVLKGGAFLVGREFISILLSLAGVLVVTRIIGPTAYGSYAAALGVSQYVVGLCQGGIGVYLVRAASDTGDRPFLVASNLLLALAMVLFVVTQASMPIITSWLNVAGFDQLLKVLLVTLPFQAAATVATAKLERALDFKRIAMVELCSQLIYYAIAVPMALTGFGVWSLVCGWCFQQIITCVILHIVADYVPRPAWSKVLVCDIARYSLGFSFAAWTWHLRALINPFIVGHFMDARAVGYVSLAVRIVEMMTIAKAIVWRLSVAAFSRIQNEPAKLLQAINYGMELQTLAIAPPLLAFAWFGNWFIPFLFGSEWVPVMKVFPFIALSYVINTQFNMHSSALFVLKKNLDVFLFNLANVVLFSVVAWFATPRLGIVGYGWGEIGAFVSYFLLHQSITRQLGMPDYRLVVMWCAATAIGLFWKDIGLWAIAVPFVALLWPNSLTRLRWIWQTMRDSDDPISPGAEAKS
jgi:O-antigen/teichoic acid export membrane protein